MIRERVAGLALPAYPSVARAARGEEMLGTLLDASAGALVWSVLRIPALCDHHPGVINLVPEAVPVICFGVMVLAPRRRAPDLRRLAWLLVPATLLLTFGPPGDEQSPLLLAYVALAAISVGVFALAILPTDPRLAIAAAVSVSTLGLAVAAINHDTSAPTWLSVAAVPAVLAIAITRTRRLQRPTPI